MSSIFSFGFLEKIGLVFRAGTPKKQGMTREESTNARRMERSASLEDVDVATRTHARIT
jgi:hypothetical protein